MEVFMNKCLSLILTVLVSIPAFAMDVNQPKYTLINKTKIVVVKGDITKQNTQAIVNAANTQLQHGSGIAGSIKKAAGVQLQPFCDKLPKQFAGHRCAVGGAVCTPAFDLKKAGIQCIIHTAGPDCRNQDQKKHKKALLHACYVESLKCAHAQKVKTIAFPSISTGVFGYDNTEAAHVAIQAIIEYANAHADFIEIKLVAFNDETYKLYRAELKKQTQSSKK